MTYTKEGKVDVSFLRADKTKKEIGKLNPDLVAYFGTQIVRNGFYHPKKIYTIFYQENYYWKAQNRNAEGIMGTINFQTPTGHLDFPVVTYYITAAPSETWFNNIHEIMHGLGFIQECSIGHKYHHLKYRNDVMSLDDSGDRYIDKKNQDYYGHSKADCPIDLKKSVFLEPTEKDAQLIPYSPSCEFDRNVRKYNHNFSLNCLAKLDF